MTPVQVLERFRQFNRSQSGMAAFYDWCEEESIKVPCIETIPEKHRYDPEWVELPVELWSQCSARKIDGKICFDNFLGIQVVLERTLLDKNTYRKCYTLGTYIPWGEVLLNIEYAILDFNATFARWLAQKAPSAIRAALGLPLPIDPSEELFTALPQETSGRTRNDRQKLVHEHWKQSKLMVLIGEAGTGKTTAALAEALKDIAEGRARKVFLARPMVGVDEEYGFLTGDLDEKTLPWMGAFEDVLGSMSEGNM